MPSLQLDRLVYGREGRPLNQPLNLQARAGEVWAILGENGAGKSTLLATLGRLLPRLGGQVFLDGVDTRGLPRKLMAQRLGLLLQRDNLGFPFTVHEAVAAGRYARRSPWQSLSGTDEAAIGEALAATGLSASGDRRVDRLSGGEQRRVAIATVLAQRPDVLLLDEPVNQLDVRYQFRLMNHFRAVASDSGAVVLLALHDVNLASRYADQVLMLYPGGDWEAGPVRRLLDRSRLQRLYGVNLAPHGDEARPLWFPPTE